VRTINYLQKVMMIASIIFCTASITTSVNAEQIKIPIGQQTATHTSVKMPAKGMTKSHVQTTFGEPLETTAARGQPPISNWKYGEFVVYFENDHVIHSVAAFKPQAQIEQAISLDE
jgi:hypothetical protein